ncbi:MAG: hypothetical protein Kow00121_53820 [Elainellaceae cyanobacterium]
MQLLDLPTQSLNVRGDRVLDSLQDIASNVQIESNFCIRHPDYKPLELPPEVVARFQHLPLPLQAKYQSLQLRSFLYGIYYNGSLRKALVPAADSGLTPEQNLENNQFQGVDLKFYEQLHSSNHGTGYFDSGWKVLRQEEDGTLSVMKDNLTLHIERERYLRLEHQPAVVGDEIDIRLPRNRVQSGFYMAISNVSSHDRNPAHEADWVRIYFNLTPEGAVAMMAAITTQLNDAAIPFKFKALYNPSDYDRFDSAVLYSNKQDYEAIRQVLQVVYPENRSHFQPEVPLFTKVLAPGLALAEEPDRKFTSKESFGTHRCQLVANGLLEAQQNNDESLESRIISIVHNFSRLGIDVNHPYLNANSEDIYATLEPC